MRTDLRKGMVAQSLTAEILMDCENVMLAALILSVQFLRNMSADGFELFSCLNENCIYEEGATQC